MYFGLGGIGLFHNIIHNIATYELPNLFNFLRLSIFSSIFLGPFQITLGPQSEGRSGEGVVFWA